MNKIKIVIAVGAFIGGFVFGKVWQERNDWAALMDIQTELLKTIQTSPLHGGTARLRGENQWIKDICEKWSAVEVDESDSGS